MTLIESETAVPSTRGTRGQRLTVADLPSPREKRWTTDKKDIVVACVNGRLLTEQEVIRRYSLTPAEYRAWKTDAAHRRQRKLKMTRAATPQRRH